MADAGQNKTVPIDTEKLSEAFKDFANRSQKIMQAFLERQAKDNGFQVADPMTIGKAFMDLSQKMMADPAKLAEAQAELWHSYAALWQNTAKRLQGEEVTPVVEPAQDDRRFKDAAWTSDALFDTIKQTYLLTSNWMQDTVRRVEGVDPDTAKKVDFYTRQFVDALSPTNFAATNPKAIETTMKTGGDNLIKGLDHLLTDLEKGAGQLRISMTKADAFELGENVATTPGKVVFQNDLMQFLQYAPSTDTVFQRPLLIVPPWINKYYILDLQPRNSFIKWAVDQGHTVFVISWVNPNETLSHKRFDDYLLDGPITALDVIEKATGEPTVNAIGYCIGGTLTACTQAYLAAKGEDRIRSVTFFTTMLDFAEPGELGVFVDEDQLKRLEVHMNKKGYLDGPHMTQVFNLMRDNDLIWSFVVNNYLMGREPLAFDLLYWNSDSTRMPAMMHNMYLRKMYLENQLVKPGGIVLDGVPIDLEKVKVPAYMVATKEDHIAPWKSTYQAKFLLKGPLRFILSASGHIAGVINPPAANKYCYWVNPHKPKDPDAWLEPAKRYEGSWWPDWQKWVRKYAGPQVDRRTPGDGPLGVIEDAPGSYVKVRLGD